MVSDTKPCPDCGGDGLCENCIGFGSVRCECDCGNRHDAPCDVCLTPADSGKSDGKCATCSGTGRVPLTDADREQAGQLALDTARAGEET